MSFITLEEIARTDQQTTMQRHVTAQPMAFRMTNLDPPSQQLFNSMNGKHMSADSLTTALNTSGSQLMQDVQGRFVSLKGNMDYNSFLTGLTLQDETIVSTDPHLQYKAMTITDEHGVLLQTKVGGRALLTNQRLLFLCSQYSQTSSLKEFGDAKKLPGGYTMEMSCNDSTYFLPIPLSAFKSIEMEGRTGVSGSISTHASTPPCKGWLGCCGCLKTWKSMPMVYNEFNEMKLMFGVLMPPWDNRRYFTLHLEPIVPIQYLKDFVSNIQTMTNRTNQK